MFAELHASLRDRTVAADPGLVRLRMGARAGGSAAVTAGALGVVVARLHAPSSVVMVGTALAMMASILVSDATARARLVTTAWIFPTAAVALAIGTWLAPHGRLAPAVMIAAAFASVWVRRYGARGLALGMIGFFAYFFALYFRAPLRELPVVLAAVATGISIAAAFRFVLLRDETAHRTARVLRAFEARARLVLEGSRRWLRSRRTRARLRLRAALEAFDEGALELEDEIANDDELRARVYEVELAVERIAEATRRTVLHGREAGNLLAVIDRVLAVTRGLCDARSDDPHVVASVDRMRRAFANGRQYARPSAVTPPVDSALFTRQAVQATIAAALAFFVGRAISDQRWPWAVLASLVVFNRSSTAGDIALRAWERVVGTVFGIVAGAALAIVLARHPYAEVGLLFVCMFVAYYFIRVSYAWSIGAMTVLLAILYGVLGRFTTSLLVVRLEETVVGAGLGALVASMVLPTRTCDRVRETAATILRAVGERLRAIAEQKPVARSVERQLRTLRDAARPAKHALFLGSRATAQIARHVAALVYCSRHLATIDADDRVRAGLRERAGIAESLASALERASHPRLSLHEVPASDPRARHWLSRVDESLQCLSRG